MPTESQCELFAAATLVESLHTMEQNWLMNRLSWFFISQSFCVAAYVDLITSGQSNILPGMDGKVRILVYGLPGFGILACIAVALSVLAASRVATRIANERAQIAEKINAKYGLSLPILGGNYSRREDSLRSTITFGNLPHYLPVVFLLLWLSLFISISLKLS